MDGRDFGKMMKDCGILDANFELTDCDLIFTKVCLKGQRKIRFNEFVEACKLIGHRKDQPCQTIANKIAATPGPVLQGTVGASRFHDDRSTYTGAHAQNEKHGGAVSRSPRPRVHDRAQPDHSSDTTNWARCKRTFDAFAGSSGDFDGREFAKLCKDAGLIDAKLKPNAVDLIFTKVTKSKKRMDWDMFTEACLQIAEKKGLHMRTVLHHRAPHSKGI